jgi:twitching motility protein PilT
LEILKVNPAAANLIREGKTFQLPSMMQTGRRDGMQLMDQALQDLVKAEKISEDEACRFAVNKALFSPQSQKAGA